VVAGKFTGFGEHAIDFYDGLNADNSKAYWTDNKETYESDVRAPMQALLDDLVGEFGDFGSSKIFRPYRDVRFGKDKTPYKNHCGGVVETGRGAGAFYVQLSSDGLLVAGGAFHCEPDQLRRMRESIADDRRGNDLAGVLDKLRKQDWTIKGEQLRTTPKGYEKDHPRIELLRYKSLYASVIYEPDDALHEPETVKRVRGRWRQVRALNEWTADHVGRPDPVDAR
jgi:uncharacterized protein (TIGR02453 family)